MMALKSKETKRQYPKLLKCLLLYFDEDDESRYTNIHSILLEKIPDNNSIFEITKEQKVKINGIHNRVNSTFCIHGNQNDVTSNLTRVNGLPKEYTLRKEYVSCGKQNSNKCKLCPHGPYYYAYWREKLPKQNRPKLRKKYLGTINPRLQNKINHEI
jgi:hypothetical protein